MDAIGVVLVLVGVSLVAAIAWCMSLVNRYIAKCFEEWSEDDE